MGHRRTALALFALLVLPAVVLAPTASACFSTVGVPCGRIYPLILIQVEDKATLYNLSQGGSIEVPAKLTYKFDVVNEGYTLAAPNEPVVVGFEFPRKPSWAEMKVEPERLEIPVNNPTYIQPDPADPTNPQGQYVYTTDILITVTLTGQAVLRDGAEFAKLLVFAKSTESGLYQSGYGIKELRVVPEGYVHESDVAGSRDVFTAVPLPEPALTDVASTTLGTTLTLTPPATAKFWEPALFTVGVAPAPQGTMVVALHDEAGNLVASTGVLDASLGTASFNATLVRPGLHTATATLLPAPGTMSAPLTLAVDFVAGSLAAEGHQFPKAYSVSASETVPAPLASSADALSQFERDIPFFAFETAQSASASVALKTTLADLGRGAANLQFSILDPDGNLLQASSVDPTNPQRSIRLGSLPAEGWYTLRVSGVGAPTATGFDVRVEVNYATAPEARNRADGIADATGGLLRRAGTNLTLPVEGLAVWAPSAITPTLEPAAGFAYQLTVYDANGTLAYASGLRSGEAKFAAPAPGKYRAFVLAQPVAGGTPFSPLVRAFSFGVSETSVTVVQKFAIEDAFEAPPLAAGETLLGLHVVPIVPGASAPTLTASGATLALVDAEGAEVTENAPPGTYFLRVSATNPEPTPMKVPVSLSLDHAAPVTLTGPDALAATADEGLRVPGLAIGIALAAIGAVAVGAAMLRRR